MSDWKDAEAKALRDALDYANKWTKEYPGTFMNKATLITMDGMSKVVDVEGTPEFITVPLFSEGKDYGKRNFQRDKFRDGEYREVPPKAEKKGFGELKTYKTLFNHMALDFALQGDDTDIGLVVHPRVFNKIHREFTGKDPAKDLTFMQITVPSCNIFIRYAPEAEKKPKTKELLLAGDLKALTLRQLVELKLAQDKK